VVIEALGYDTIDIALETPGQTARDLLVAPIGSGS